MTLRDSNGRFISQRDVRHAGLRQYCRERLIDQAVRYVADGGQRELWGYGRFPQENSFMINTIRSEFARLAKAKAL